MRLERHDLEAELTTDNGLATVSGTDVDQDKSRGTDGGRIRRQCTGMR
jgi:hypothetical protein